ncbi:DUF4166 domain-containing protein [Bacillus sp. Hm123]|uniref:DUF4166 domain-containing protein n=1 Tax=Bacillus sp. Hm123 TaxID=3450745 RepID=UPI003F436549
MPSIYQTILGDSFTKLHPMLQHRYTITTEKSFYGQGKMEEISGGSRFIRPLFQWGVKRRLFFSERGRDIPFFIKNTAYKAGNGREHVRWNRYFTFDKKERHFDAVMYLDSKKRKIIDDFGIPSFLVSTLDFQVDTEGCLHISSNKQWLKLFGKNIPLPTFLYGNASIIESFQEDKGCFHVEVHVSNPLVGTLFYYKGYFHEVECEQL